MYSRSRQFVSIARLAALETIRQPVYLLVATASVLATALIPLLTMFALGESERMARDSGLAFHFVGGLILGSFAACSSFTREIRRGTAASVLSKPVPREVFFLAKYAGIAAVMTSFSAAVAAATLLAARAGSGYYIIDWTAAGPLLAAPFLAFAAAGAWNFFTRRPFASAAFVLLIAAIGAAIVFALLVRPAPHFHEPGEPLFDVRILSASLLVTFAILVLSGISVSLSVGLDIVPTLAVSSVALFAGLMSDYLLGRHAAASRVAAVAYALVPNWQHFWVTDALAGDGAIPWAYVARAAAYAAAYLAAVLSLGMLVFRRMEVKA